MLAWWKTIKCELLPVECEKLRLKLCNHCWRQCVSINCSEVLHCKCRIDKLCPAVDETDVVSWSCWQNSETAVQCLPNRNRRLWKINNVKIHSTIKNVVHRIINNSHCSRRFSLLFCNKMKLWSFTIRKTIFLFLIVALLIEFRSYLCFVFSDRQESNFAIKLIFVLYVTALCRAHCYANYFPCYARTMNVYERKNWVTKRSENFKSKFMTKKVSTRLSSSPMSSSVLFMMSCTMTIASLIKREWRGDNFHLKLSWQIVRYFMSHKQRWTLPWSLVIVNDNIVHRLCHFSLTFVQIKLSLRKAFRLLFYNIVMIIIMMLINELKTFSSIRRKASRNFF